MNKKVEKEDVMKALESLGVESVSKASEEDLDQPEGGELEPGSMEGKMSDEAGAPEKKKVKKAEDEEEGSDEDEAEDEKEKLMKMKAKKSFAEELPEEIETKIDVSDFLKSLVNHTAESIDGLKDVLVKGEELNDQRFTALASTVEDVQQAQAKIGIVLKALCEAVGVIKSSPAREAKAETIAKSDASIERNFKSALETEGAEKVFKSLSDNPAIAKSQISEAMCGLVRKGEATDMDVIGFESGGYIRPELIGKLKEIL